MFLQQIKRQFYFMSDESKSFINLFNYHKFLSIDKNIMFSFYHFSFTLHSFLPYYYSIRGKSKDGFCYVCYINGGHYPFTILDHIKNLCSTICSLSLFTWLINRVRSVFNWVCYHTIAKFNFPQ